MSISQSLPTTDPAFRLNFQGARRLDPRMAFTRASTATYVDEDGLIKTAGVDQARFDYDPATGESLGLLIEESRTNIHNTQGTLDGITNPEGITGKQYFMNWSASSYTVRRQRPKFSYSLSAGNYTLSFYFKTSGQLANGNYTVGRSMNSIDNTYALGIQFIALTGDIANSTNGGNISKPTVIEKLENSWYRASITATYTGSGTGFFYWYPSFSSTTDVDTNTGFYVWGVQLEAGSFPTSYIPTSGSAVTRSADTATFSSQEISTTGTLLSLGGGSATSPASYNSSEVNTSTNVITLNSQLSDSSTIPTLLYYPEPISGNAIKAMRAYAPIVKDGLVLHLDAGIDKSYPNSGTTWWDLSGQGNDGTLTNGPTYSSANGGSLVFDGVNDYAPITTTGLPFGNSPGTLSCWAKTNTITGGFSWTVSYGTATLSQSRFLGINGSTYYFGGFGDDILASGVPLNTWFNMVGVYDGTNASMYINGTLVSGPTAKSWNTVANNAQLGRQTNESEYWNGNIAQVSIYNRALTASEILQNFNASRSRFNI